MRALAILFDRRVSVATTDHGMEKNRAEVVMGQAGLPGNAFFSKAIGWRDVARPKRFELLTPRFVVWCSIQLSYGRWIPLPEPDRGTAA